MPELHTATVVAHANANLARDPRRTQTRQLARVHPAGTLGLVIMHKCFGRMDKKMQSGLSTDFSMVRSPNRVLKPLKSASFEIRIASFFVNPSKIFVWEGYNSHLTFFVHDGSGW